MSTVVSSFIVSRLVLATGGRTSGNPGSDGADAGFRRGARPARTGAWLLVDRTGCSVPSMALRTSLVPALLISVAAAQNGCEACEGQHAAKRDSSSSEPRAECDFASDCASDNPCVEADCVNDRCLENPAPRGRPCGEATACSGAAECDGRGRCVPGAPLEIDDGNPCTTDSCDTKRGVVHEPVPVDDSDACTADACDPRSGEITHDPVDIDDGDDCTFDTCDPETGVSHAGLKSKYTCAATCDPGYHVTFRRPSAACAGGAGVQSYCQPNCGFYFYTCDPKCPAGYRAGSRQINDRCGPTGEPQTYCTKATANP